MARLGRESGRWIESCLGDSPGTFLEVHYGDWGRAGLTWAARGMTGIPSSGASGGEREFSLVESGRYGCVRVPQHNTQNGVRLQLGVLGRTQDSQIVPPSPTPGAPAG